MKTKFYKRIRLGGILLCLALIVACVAPIAALASEASEQDSVHFINPTAITVVGDVLYVADNVEDNKTALLCFDLTDKNSPKLLNTYEIADKVTGLSNNGTDVIYAICGTKLVELRLNGESEPTVGNTYARFDDSDDVQLVSVAYGAQFRLDENTLYALTADKILYLSAEQNKFIQFTNIVGLSDTKGCYILKENDASYLYYIANNTCSRFNLTSNSGDTLFALNLAVTPKGIFGGQAEDAEFVGLYNSNGIYKIEGSGSSQSGTLRYDTISLFKEPNEVYANDSIVAVESHDETLIVLNSRNQIDLFDINESGYYNHEPICTIGSDMVDRPVPTTYTSFTLVRPKGYPANIVYKTNADTSVPDIITDASEYVIIGYDGAESSHYYYVLVGDKFGWVKKSDNASTPQADDKLTVIKNNPSGVEGIIGEAKFVSPHAVFVYKLPLSNSTDYETVEQTALTMKTVKILQEFKEGDTVWYYVNYDEGKTGFVKNSDVGAVRFTAETLPKVEGLRKINSSLFSAVNVYRTKDLTEGDYLPDVDGNVIKLYSSDRVTLIETDGNAAFVMIQHDSDNSKNDYGWIDASRLIGVHQITTNAIVGLSLLAVAIALTTVLLVIYFKRKKKIKRNNG